MPLTIQKLQRRVAELEAAALGTDTVIAPVYVAPATGPMTSPPDASDDAWQRIEIGQMWGMIHSTQWLKAALRVPPEMIGQSVLFQLYWGPGEFDFRRWVRDPLLVVIEATIFLDGKPIGALD